MFYTLIVVVVTELYAFVKTHFTIGKLPDLKAKQKSMAMLP